MSILLADIYTSINNLASSNLFFLKVVPNEDTRHALFDLDKEILREKLAFRIFELPGGVFVSAPLEQVGQPHQLGKHVTVEDGDGFRFLSCSGRIVNEKVAATQARPRSRQTSVSGSTSTP